MPRQRLKLQRLLHVQCAMRLVCSSRLWVWDKRLAACDGMGWNGGGLHCAVQCVAGCSMERGVSGTADAC